MNHRNKYSGTSDYLSENKGKSSAGSCLFSIPPEQYTIISSLLGVLLIDNLNLSQQNSLGNFLVGVGQTLLTAASQGQLIQADEEKNERIFKQLDELKRKISELERELK